MPTTSFTTRCDDEFTCPGEKVSSASLSSRVPTCTKQWTKFLVTPVHGPLSLSPNLTVFISPFLIGETKKRRSASTAHSHEGNHWLQADYDCGRVRALMASFRCM